MACSLSADRCCDNTDNLPAALLNAIAAALLLVPSRSLVSQKLPESCCALSHCDQNVH
jgi:hypothetical protein